MCSYIISRCRTDSCTSTCTGCRRCKKDEATQSGDGAMEEAVSAVRNSSLLFWSFAKNLFVFVFHPRLLDNKLSLRVYAKEEPVSFLSLHTKPQFLSFSLSTPSLFSLLHLYLPAPSLSLSCLELSSEVYIPRNFFRNCIPCSMYLT